jgi:hypothetical protein
MNHFWSTYWRNAFLGLELGLLAPIPALLVWSSVISLAWSSKRERPLASPAWRNYYWLALTQSLFFPAFIWVSAIAPYDYGHAKESPLAHRAIPILCFAALGLAVFWIFRMRGLRGFAASLMGVQLGITMGGFGVALLMTSGVFI